jgi:hypothetical protein
MCALVMMQSSAEKDVNPTLFLVKATTLLLLGLIEADTGPSG